jgi:hypothetical protein
VMKNSAIVFLKTLLSKVSTMFSYRMCHSLGFSDYFPPW